MTLSFFHHDYSIHIILTGHKKYLGFLYLYSTYNNAVVHVFIRLLANSRTTSNLRANVSATSETTFGQYKRADFDDDTKEAAHDSIELMEAEPADQDSPVPSAHFHTSEYNSKVLIVMLVLFFIPCRSPD